ncbi:MAG: mannose-6-phosphate isomerase, partial [Novosphingobium sp.]|nr:mannose-6-phosphate isomerase [Novosphingobium sp.]
GPLFRLEQVEGEPDADIRARFDGPVLLIPRHGPVHVDGEEIPPGGCALAEALSDVAFVPYGICLIAQPCK